MYIGDWSVVIDTLNGLLTPATQEVYLTLMTGYTGLPIVIIHNSTPIFVFPYPVLAHAVGYDKAMSNAYHYANISYISHTKIMSMV
jgi:hypothetical protein